MRRLLPVLFAAGLLAAPTTPAAPDHPDYGVVTSVQFLDGVTLERLRELGVGSVRVEIGRAHV